jgi:surface antigen
MVGANAAVLVPADPPDRDNSGALAAFLSNDSLKDKTGGPGDIWIAATFTDPGGHSCRQYVQTITIGGRAHEAFGIVCKQPAGEWRVVAPVAQASR